jgi:endonuclease YncB( thermonuclease family)
MLLPTGGTYAADPPAGVPKGAEKATVNGALDGDKITVTVGGKTETVLLIGVDAPELSKDGRAECYAREAADRMKALAPKGSTVYLESDEKDHDKKDLLLRYVWIPGEGGGKAYLLNTKLVREGDAGFDQMKPNDRYDKNLKKAEQDAQDKALGLWGACGKLHTTALRCEDVPQALVDGIASGIKPETGATLRGAQAVRSEDFDKVWFIAADLEGPGLDGPDQIGLWATNSLEAGSGLIFSVDGTAKEFTDWGDGGQTDAHLSTNDDGASEAKACVQRALS